jgi:hypothetical protein
MLSLDDFIGKQIDVTACVIRESGGRVIRLKCPKRIINTLGIPEKGLVTVHIKGNIDTVSYNVTGSSMRVNLGAGFAYLFYGEENRITVTFKVYNGKLDLFYKEDEQSLFPIWKKSARYEDGWRFCTYCQKFFKEGDRCPIHGLLLRTSQRKKGSKHNGNKL